MQKHSDNMDGSTSSIKVTRRDDLSLLYRVMRLLMRQVRPRLAGMPKTPYPAGSQKLKHPNLSVKVQERQVEGVYLYDLIVHGEKRRPTHRMYYFHGGGFQTEPSKDHWKLCAEFAQQLSATHDVTVVSYPLAPSSPAAEALPVLKALLRALVKDAADDNKHLVLAGDSSGGNIALCLGFYWATEIASTSMLPAPISVFAMSPAVDLTHSNPDIDEVDRHDPLLRKDMCEKIGVTWAGTLPKDSPEVSPLFGNFDALRMAGVKVHGLIGTYDNLAPDDIGFYKALSQHGIEGEWLEWKGQMHCFPLAFSYGIRECKEGKDWIIDVLRRDAQSSKVKP